MNNKAIALATGLIAVVGCAQFPGLSTNSDVTLTVLPEIVQSDYSTQTDVSLVKYASASVTAMDVTLYTITNIGEATGSEVFKASKTFNSAPPYNAVVFSNLHNNTNYRIKAVAHKADNAIISEDSTNSFTDIAVGTDDRPAIALKCKLIDPVFNGQGTGSIAITGSEYTYPGNEALN